MQLTEKGYVKLYITVPWMIGVALLLGIIDVYIIGVLPADSLWHVWGTLALTALIVGACVGWFWARWGLLLLLFVPPIFIYIGYLRVRPFYSNDVGWGLPVFLYLIPTLPFLLLGIALSAFLSTRHDTEVKSSPQKK
jgi:hypothetical protein